jgi:hypothetical protein
MLNNKELLSIKSMNRLTLGIGFGPKEAVIRPDGCLIISDESIEGIDGPVISFTKEEALKLKEFLNDNCKDNMPDDVKLAPNVEVLTYFHNKYGKNPIRQLLQGGFKPSEIARIGVIGFSPNPNRTGHVQELLRSIKRICWTV